MINKKENLKIEVASSARSFDGINLRKLKIPKNKIQKPVLVDGIVLCKRKKLAKKAAPVLPIKFKLKKTFQIFNFFATPQKISFALVCLMVIASFFLGMQAVLRTNKSFAEDELPPPNAQNQPIPLAPAPGTPVEQVPNSVLFNLPISLLEDYLNEALKSDETKAAEILQKRTEAVSKYLSSKNSPLLKYADVIAAQKHWKLILAISNAESGMGKHCANNNCSGIGVAPGASTWREYRTLKDWIVDFNNLLEKRYRGWTLEQMNGVYVQPKNPNWMLATKQVLQDMQELGIE
jgi:hypothetical protein